MEQSSFPTPRHGADSRGRAVKLSGNDLAADDEVICGLSALCAYGRKFDDETRDRLRVTIHPDQLSGPLHYAERFSVLLLRPYPCDEPAYQSKYASGGTPPTNVTASLSAAYGGDAYIASFNFATTGPTVGLYENEGGLSALSAR